MTNLPCVLMRPESRLGIGVLRHTGLSSKVACTLSSCMHQLTTRSNVDTPPLNDTTHPCIQNIKARVCQSRRRASHVQSCPHPALTVQPHSYQRPLHAYRVCPSSAPLAVSVHGCHAKQSTRGALIERRSQGSIQNTKHLKTMLIPHSSMSETRKQI